MKLAKSVITWGLRVLRCPQGLELGTAMLPGESQPNLSGDAAMQGRETHMPTQTLLIGCDSGD